MAQNANVCHDEATRRLRTARRLWAAASLDIDRACKYGDVARLIDGVARMRAVQDEILSLLEAAQAAEEAR